MVIVVPTGSDSNTFSLNVRPRRYTLEVEVFSECEASSTGASRTFRTGIALQTLAFLLALYIAVLSMSSETAYLLSCMGIRCTWQILDCFLLAVA